MAGRTLSTIIPWAIVSLLALEVLVWGVIISPSWVAGEIQAERAAVAQWVGPDLEGWLWTKTEGLYQKIAVRSGAEDKAQEIADSRMAEGSLRSEQVVAFEGWRTEWINERLVVLREILRQALFRFGVITLVALYTLPALAAALVDSLVIRARRRAEARMASPRVYHLGKRLVTVAAIGPVVIMLSPIGVSPAWIIGWAALMVWLIWGVMQHVEVHA